MKIGSRTLSFIFTAPSGRTILGRGLAALALTGTLFASPNLSTTRALSLPYSSPCIYHVVRKGEALSRISAHYGTSPDVLMRANRLQTARVRNGQRLCIPTHKPGSNIPPAPKSNAISVVVNGKGQGNTNLVIIGDHNTIIINSGPTPTLLPSPTWIPTWTPSPSPTWFPPTVIPTLPPTATPIPTDTPIPTATMTPVP